MTDQQDPRVDQDARGPNGLNIRVGRDFRAKKSIFAGGNVTITKIKNYSRNHPVISVTIAAVIALVGGYSTYGVVDIATSGGSKVDVSVVDQPGAAGAVRTAEEIRVAERVADAAAWCTLVAPSDGGCEKSMAGAFAQRSQDYRDKVDAVTIGKATATDTDAEVPLSWKGKKQGTIPLEWSGGRWQLGNGNYGLVKLGGGVFLSLVDAQEGNLKLGGIPIPS
ncbi:hypothetical protein OG242_15170 [Streptomyces sp. NBC_00727]|uniref:hypothetical protein n=1 Tax=Streptomyces sp. NBC_00727 TaxID=2903675 RepID=UPI00386CFF04